MSYRILVTGSRTWWDYAELTLHLNDVVQENGGPGNVVIVHGACPRGADEMADQYANACAIKVERHPADWERHGRRAGFIRNAEMVELGADICLAFIRDGSRGATHTADLAEKAGIPVRRWTA